jgi:hypothetical protein
LVNYPVVGSILTDSTDSSWNISAHINLSKPKNRHLFTGKMDKNGDCINKHCHLSNKHGVKQSKTTEIANKHGN